MDALYVLEPGCYLRKEGSSLKIVKDAEVVDQIPASDLKRLTLVGYVSLSGSVLDFLIRNRVETVFLTPTGRFRARLGLDEHRHVTLRKAQYVRLGDEKFALETAKILVSGKLRNMIAFMLLRARQYDAEALRMATARLKALRAAVAGARDTEALRGAEGAATRVYFEGYPALIRNPAFPFSGRTRRPPLDPVNALLSFVYTLLTNEVLSAVTACGLDPYLGCLHEISYGRPSLACDLVEEYRCFLGDRLVLGLINRQAISPEDFVYRAKPPAEFVDEEEMKSKRPLEMKPSTGQAFIKAYEEMMKRSIHYPPMNKKVTYRWLIHQQVGAFGQYLESPEKGYQPFSWEE
jgi:CRISPR-associated protein Cas1